MTYQEKTEFVCQLTDKINEVMEYELKNAMRKENIMGMTLDDLEHTKRTIELVGLLNDYVKGVSYELADIRNLVEMNNQLLIKMQNK